MRCTIGASFWRRKVAFGALCALSLALLDGEGGASNGTKAPANGTQAFGRGGADIAWSGDPLSMNSNPASIVGVKTDRLSAAPIILFLNSEYKDGQNSSESHTGVHPYANVAAVIDPAAIFGRGTSERVRPLPVPDPFKEYHSSATYDIRSAGEFTLRAKPAKFPSRADVRASGAGSSVRDLALVARYYAGTQREYTAILAVSQGPFELDAAPRSIATFSGLANLLRDKPDELVLYGTAEGAAADITLVLDGSVVGGETVDAGRAMGNGHGNGNGNGHGNGNGNGHGNRAQDPPFERPSDRPVIKATDEPSDWKFGVGFFVQAGAGADLKLATELYPEGVVHRSELSFVSLTPTLGWRLLEWLNVGGTIQLNYASINTDHPVTKDSDIMQGNLFPAGSLDAALGGAFGLPTQFGPAMKYSMNTSSTHAPGTSITHTSKPNDVGFGEITGSCKLKNATSFGWSAKLGLQAKITDRLTMGLTWQSPSFMEDYKGKAKIDYNRQIQAFVNNPTQGHSNEIDLLGVPTELRYTFDQVWNQGVVDVYAFDSLIIPNFPMPSGPIVASLPNGGANGFASTYDMTIKDHQMPMEFGLGFSYRLTDWLTLGLDYKRILWSQAMDEFRVELRNGTNPDVNALVGSSDLDTVVPLNWKDQNVFALGAEAVVAPWITLRAGYNYANNPVPEDTFLPLTPVIAEHHVSFGASIRLGGGFRFDVAIMHTFENTIRISESQHTRDLNGAKFTAGQDFVALGVIWDF